METLILPPWHVLYVRHRHEKKVELLLKDKNIDVFLPIVKYINIWSDRKKRVYKPLFTNYVFVRPNSKNDFYRALSTKGVIKYVRFGSEYALVRAREIFQIKQLLNLDGISEVEITTDTPRKGQKMKINYGQLHGMDCEVIKVNNKSKIFVKVESIRHIITACVPNFYLTPRLSSKDI